MKKLKPHKVDKAQIERFLASADRKLVSAQKILAFDEEACLQQAYEAIVKSLARFHVQLWLSRQEPARTPHRDY
jgi:hypothetical protein